MAGSNAVLRRVIDADAPHPDGRRERSRSSRRRIIEAMMALMAEGDVDPSAARVAERAGVGQRTVFRHFDDKESLYREIDAVLWETYRPIVEAPFQSGDWQEQLFELIERRAHIHEELAPYRIASSIQRFNSPALMDRYRFMLRTEREKLASILPDHIRRDSHRARAILLAVSFDSWRLFRHDEELSNEKTIAVLKQMLRDILEQAPDGNAG